MPCSFLDPLPAIQGLREASGRGQGKPLAVRSYSLAWSPGIHFRTPRRLQRVVLLLLMAQRRPGAVARLPKALWIDRILPLL
ncbi:unnamed protein product [Effrenium voratum]|uniref:Uncharacterized protein n=1 Tax=Effrenium voratum TaxID=2562239 RepID=A0AA36NEU3_9DINO|nr:unnamed protein product [Effrenium voratum]